MLSRYLEGFWPLAPWAACCGLGGPGGAVGVTIVVDSTSLKLEGGGSDSWLYLARPTCCELGLRDDVDERVLPRSSAPLSRRAFRAGRIASSSSCSSTTPRLSGVLHDLFRFRGIVVASAAVPLSLEDDISDRGVKDSSWWLLAETAVSANDLRLRRRPAKNRIKALSDLEL